MLNKIPDLAKLTPADYNRAVDAINQFLQMKAAAPLNVTVAGGIPQIRLSESGWMAKTTASVGTGKYTVVEVQRSTAGAWTVVSDGRTLDAYEWNKKTGIKNGTIVRVEPFFDGDWRFFAGSGGGGGDGGDGSGDDCGFLLDVPTTKAFKLELLSGVGRCACFDLEQGNDPNAPIYLFYNSTLMKWVADRTFCTCCGAGRFTLAIDEPTATATATIEINQPCDEIPPTYTAPYTYTLKQEGCYKGDGTSDNPPYIIVAGAGPKNCDAEPIECDNTFRVKLSCVPCPDLLDCSGCTFAKSPNAYFLDLTSGFSGDYAAYTGLWFLAANIDTGGCEYFSDCNGITMTLTLTTGLATLVLSGAAGGGLTYTYTDPGNPLTCLDGLGLTNETPPEGTAGSVSLVPISCTEAICPCLDTFQDGTTATITGCLAPNDGLPVVLSVMGNGMAGSTNSSPTGICDGPFNGQTTVGFTCTAAGYYMSISILGYEEGCEGCDIGEEHLYASLRVPLGIGIDNCDGFCGQTYNYTLPTAACIAGTCSGTVTFTCPGGAFRAASTPEASPEAEPEITPEATAIQTLQANRARRVIAPRKGCGCGGNKRIINAPKNI